MSNSVPAKFQRIDILYYLLVFMVLKLSRDPFFISFEGAKLIPFLLLGLLFVVRGHRFEWRFFYLILIVICLIGIQGFIWGFKLLTVFTYMSFVILTPYFLFKVLGTSLFRYLINIIYFFSITSLFFWFLQNISPPFDNWLQHQKDVFFEYSWDRWPRSLVLYTVAITKADLSLIDLYRNSGIFHEPGGYAVWLIFGIGLNTIITGKPFHRKNILMIIALLTTFSTTGYLQLFTLMLFFMLRSRLPAVFKTVVFISFVFSSFLVYNNAEFLGEKIEQQYETQAELELKGTFTSGRFIRAFKALNVIQQSPLLGRGIITASADMDKYSAYYISGVTSLKIFADFGLIFGFLYFVYFYRGIKKFILENNYYPRFAFYFLIALFLGGLSQTFFYDTISIQFFFVGLLAWRNPKVIQVKNNDFYLSKETSLITH